MDDTAKTVVITGAGSGFGALAARSLAHAGHTVYAPMRDTTGRNAARVADAIVEVVDAPYGTRPFRVHVDPANDGSEEVSRVADRIRAEFLTRIGLADLLAPHDSAAPAAAPAGPVARHA
ncbi:hypothetical protein [Streptomyces sp. NPDC006645]|uniref:hypothetical protein n=1 Tax=unclassified Streptomyces TaxID=2593676 RepID=UPI0033AC11F3